MAKSNIFFLQIKSLATFDHVRGRKNAEGKSMYRKLTDINRHTIHTITNYFSDNLRLISMFS